MDSWPDGDLIEHASIDGPFEMGSQITSQLRGFPETSSTVTLVDRPRRWVNEATMGDLTMWSLKAMATCRRSSAARTSPISCSSSPGSS